MKFVITDSKSIHKFRLPQDKQKIYTINVKINLSNNYVNEIITLNKEDKYWTLNSSEEYNIYKN